MSNKEWFTGDKEGLRQHAERFGKARVVVELVANALDAGGKNIRFSLDPIAGKPRANLLIEDDGEGFLNLSHAYTLFAKSNRRDDAEKRGRFNLGEKLFLSICNNATITSTTGSVVFDEEGRHEHRTRRSSGTILLADVAMTRAEVEETLKVLKQLLVPFEVRLTVNNERLPSRGRHHHFTATLQTDLQDNNGEYTRKTRRSTTVELYPFVAGLDEKPMIYELGIPVVELEGGDRWHINVTQKVPLTMSRDNVPPAYLSYLRALVLNEMKDKLSSEDAAQPWVAEALENTTVSPEAVLAATKLRFGDKFAAATPGYEESNSNAFAMGYTVIPPTGLSANAREKLREIGELQSTKQIAPPKIENIRSYIDPQDYTEAEATCVKFTKHIARCLLGFDIAVWIAEISGGVAACYGRGELTFNVKNVEFAKAYRGQRKDLLDLIIHELGHHYESNHLNYSYHKAVTDLGARMTIHALEFPQDFDIKRWT